ncbi:GNAT family N-acetyltransferase [Salinarimonas chemoclinalis]|uniref:GNAT family N-acetyltransferase n=1 Tax=Salinarimonas chemoclinalis TaxID=3241599 RepID=UPI003558A591
MTTAISIVDQPSDDVRRAILAPLDVFSRERGFPFEPRTLALALLHDDHVVGGLVGQLNWDWLYIQILGVPTFLRGGGHGRALVEEAERRAVAAGCRGVWVDTFTFQSPGFYERLGYEKIGELPGYPGDQSRLFLRKLLTDR